MITSENKIYVAYRISYIIYVPNINEKVIIFYMLQLNFHGEERGEKREREREREGDRERERKREGKKREGSKREGKSKE